MMATKSCANATKKMDLGHFWPNLDPRGLYTVTVTAKRCLLGVYT